MNRNELVYVAGHRGMVGSAIIRALKQRGFNHVVVRTRAELDLTQQTAVQQFFAAERPRFVFLAAAKVGGILANSESPAEFIQQNLLIQAHVIDAAYRCGTTKLCFLGSSCIYPRLAPQPMKEEYLLTGPLEPTNQWYAVAKIAGIKMCQAYRLQHSFDAISLMPTNLYGPGDSFDLQNSHVVPALIRKTHEAKRHGDSSVVIWGTGQPRRELLHVDDLAEAALFLMEHYDDGEIVNVGVGEDLSIRELAELIAEVVGFDGDLNFDTSKPDGAPRKLLDVSKITALGWRPRIGLREGLEQTYAWYLEHLEESRGVDGVVR